MNRYQIVTNNARSSDRFESADPVTSFAARGFKFTKMEAREYLRDELQGQPKFEGLCGPMWGGTDSDDEPVIRYEDWASYEILSR